MESDQHAFKEEVEEVIDAARGRPWHVVQALDCRAASSSGPAAARPPVDISEEVEAVIVLVDPQNARSACEVLHGLRFSAPLQSTSVAAAARASVSRPAILALLLRGEGSPNEEAILTVRQCMLDSGADEVLWKCGTTQEIRFAILLRLAGVQEARRSSQGDKEQLQRQIAELKSRADDLQDRQRDATNGIFWKSAHRICRGFPQMQADAQLIDMQVGPLKLEEFLGHGSCGVVYSAVNTQTKELEAVKVIEKVTLVEMEDVQSLWMEIRFLGALQHKNIIKMYGALHGSHQIFIRMEHAGQNDACRALRRAGGRFSLGWAHRCQAQLVSAVAYCHASGVAHRDVKPENMCLSCDGSFTLKLLDFGAATSLNEPSSDLVGTMPFAAPEVLETTAAKPYDAARSDVWSCGVVLLEMLCGLGKMNCMLGWGHGIEPSAELAQELKTFFQDHVAMLATVQQDLVTVARPLEALLVGAFQVDPTRRWTASQMEQCHWMQHGP